MKPTLLITGGAGYIGSHTAYLMAQHGYHVIILDTFVHDQPWHHTWATVIRADCADKKTLDTIFSMHRVEAVMHFAAFIDVGASVKDPAAYYENNVTKTLHLLTSMLEHNVKKFIFSSSCAVYGIPHRLPLTEDHPRNPVSPYGTSKYMIELMLEDFQRAYGLEYVALRYFNAAGALADYGLGEYHKPETHLIPLLLNAAYQRTPFSLFGTHHPTADGSCVRDFLHVWDIAHAHRLALMHLIAQQPSDCFNLGTGTGYSVKQMIAAVEQICGMPITTITAQSRAGDPPTLVADASRAQTILGWQPRHSSLEFIIKSALAHTWNKRHSLQNDTLKLHT